MAMNTVATTSSVGQVDRSNPTITTNAKVTNDSSAPFQPQTQVNIDNSMKNMLTMLSKIAISEDTPIQEMPAELQKLVNDILQNAFSLDNSISQGLSNTLQSQKASIDQLNLLSKLLEQLSMEVSTEGIANLSDTFKTLLANTKLLDGQDGKILDSTALNKMAMQLLDGKSMENMPEVLQTLLVQSNQSNAMLQTQQSGSDMNFLKQLIKQFMPSPQENQTTTYANQNNTTNTTTYNTNQTVMNANNGAVNSNSNTQNNTTTNQTITNNNIETNPNSMKNNTQNNASDTQQATMIKDNSLNKTVTTNQTMMHTTSSDQSSEISMKSQDGNLKLASENQNSSTNVVIKKDSNNGSQDAQNNMINRNSIENGQQNQPNKTSLPLQNTTVTMQLMKNLANQMLSGKNVSLSMEEFGLLKNFVNDKQQVLNEREVKNLQTLIKMSEENLPATIRQAAIKQKLPNLSKLWSFVQLCDLTQLTDLPANKLKSASKSISDFAGLLKSSMQNENDVNENQNQRSMSLMTPLYLGDNAHCYPTYIHVYDQTADGRDIDDNQKETWFRICLLTENMGAVELVFRLYEQSKLNLRVTFSDDENVKSFNEYMPEIEAAFKELPLDLTEVKVSAIGG